VESLNTARSVTVPPASGNVTAATLPFEPNKSAAALARLPALLHGHSLPKCVAELQRFVAVQRPVDRDAGEGKNLATLLLRLGRGRLGH
jgi:hypothetical protein